MIGMFRELFDVGPGAALACVAIVTFIIAMVIAMAEYYGEAGR